MGCTHVSGCCSRHPKACTAPFETVPFNRTASLKGQPHGTLLKAGQPLSRLSSFLKRSQSTGSHHGRHTRPGTKLLAPQQTNQTASWTCKQHQSGTQPNQSSNQQTANQPNQSSDQQTASQQTANQQHPSGSAGAFLESPGGSAALGSVAITTLWNGERCYP